MNLYATKKTAAEGMLDIALFLANITHMKTVIEQGAGYRYAAKNVLDISYLGVSKFCVNEKKTVYRKDLKNVFLGKPHSMLHQ